MLRGEAFALHSGDANHPVVVLYASPADNTGAPTSAGKIVTRTDLGNNNGGDGYAVYLNALTSGTAVVPLNSNLSIDYKVVASGVNATNGYYGNLYVVGYIGGGVLPPPAPSVSCSLNTDGGSTGADNTNGNKTPVGITANVVGGAEAYTYAYNIGKGYGTFGGVSTYSTTFATPGTYNLAVEAKGVRTGTVISASCPTLTVTYPKLVVGTLSCSTSAGTTSGTGAAKKETIKYTIKGTPTGGNGGYKYQVQTIANGDIAPLTPTQLSTPTGLYPASPTTYTAAGTSISVVYQDVSGSNADDIQPIIYSADGQTVNTTATCIGPNLI